MTMVYFRDLLLEVVEFVVVVLPFFYIQVSFLRVLVFLLTISLLGVSYLFCFLQSQVVIRSLMKNKKLLCQVQGDDTYFFVWIVNISNILRLIFKNLTMLLNSRIVVVTWSFLKMISLN